MKKIAIFSLDLYKGSISIFLKSLGVTTTCRFSPSCSEYTKKMIENYGFIQGVSKGISQFKKCHPLGGIYGTNI